MTLLDLRNAVRVLADVQGDPNVPDAYLTSLINRHASELFDRLADASPERYAAESTISVLPGTSLYPLPADFRNLTAVYSVQGNDARALSPMPVGARSSFVAPEAAATLTVEYMPVGQVLSADTDTLDGVSGWAELIVNLVARDVAIGRQDDPAAVMSNIARLEARITSRSRRRDRNRSPRATNTDAINSDVLWGRLSNAPLYYRLRGDTLEILSSRWHLP